MLRTKENEWTIFEWDESLAYDSSVKYLAGQECAHRMLDKFLSSAKPPLIVEKVEEQPTEQEAEKRGENGN